MQRETYEILNKEEYSIKDLAKLVKKETNTIRSWEGKGIIFKPENKFDNGWRKYSKDDLKNVLIQIINYKWQRKIIKNEEELKIVIQYLNGDIDFNDSMSLME